MVVDLMVTGDLERLSLHTSLARAFGLGDAWPKPEFVRAAFTTSRLRAGGSLPSPLVRLASRAVARFEPGRRDGEPLPDHLVVIDDLELANQDQPHVAVEFFRRAIEQEVVSLGLNAASERRLRSRLRQSCSFHLLVPMVETYFFMDPLALARAGTRDGVDSHLVDDDVEFFETADPGYLESSARANPHHPKRYLSFLVQQHRGEGQFYSEVRDGQPALRSLQWACAPVGVSYIRALFEDLAESLQCDSPLGPAESTAATSMLVGDTRGFVLRNT